MEPTISLEDHKIQSTTFNINGQVKGNLKINFNQTGNLDTKNKKFILIVEISIEKEKMSEKEDFLLAAKSITNFQVNGEIKPEQFNELAQEFTFYAIKVVFPFIRNYIASFTAITGIPPLTLPDVKAITLNSSKEKK